MFARCFICVLYVSSLWAGQVRYAYDASNRVIRVTYIDGTVVTYTYDAAGNRTSQVIRNASIPQAVVTTDKPSVTLNAAAAVSGIVATTVTISNVESASVTWTAVASASWLSVSPSSGTNRATITIAANASGLPEGVYTGSVTIMGTGNTVLMVIPVTLVVGPSAAAMPLIGSGGTVNGASFLPGVAPGSIASLFGTSLARDTQTASSIPLPTSLGNVRVLVGGVPAPLFYVSPQQLNFQVPFEAPADGYANVMVVRGDASSSLGVVSVLKSAPGIFGYQRVASATDPIITHGNGQLVTPDNPAAAGEVLVVWTTGLGDVSNQPLTGTASPASPLAIANTNPVVTVADRTAAVQFAGLTGGFVGLAQINIQLPDMLPQGSTLPLVIRFGSSASQIVNLAVKSASPTSGPYEIATVAGSGQAGADGDGGPAIQARLNQPGGVAVDHAGAVYIADSGSRRVRRVSGGIISTVSASETAALAGSPTRVQFDPEGNLYIADTRDYLVRQLTTAGRTRIVAGTGAPGFSLSMQRATSAPLSHPAGMAADGMGNLYIADELSHRVLKVTADGEMKLVAGTGVHGFAGDDGAATLARLASPMALAVDGFGGLYIADAGNHRIRFIAPNGTIRTIAGTGLPGASGDGGAAVSAQLMSPAGLVADFLGNLYIADTGNNRVLKIGRDGVVNVIAGTSQAGYSGDSGPATAAQLNAPQAIAIDADGTIYVADTGNNRIRKLTPTHE